MTKLDPETRFLAAIGRAAEARLGAGHPLAVAAKKRDQSPEDTARVHELLAALSEADRDRLLAEAHREMRQDIAAIWDLLPGGARSGTVH